MGGDAPSTGFSRNDVPALTMEATWTPGRPTVVSSLAKATKTPALTPDSTLIDGNCGVEGAASAGGTLRAASNVEPDTAAATADSLTGSCVAGESGAPVRRGPRWSLRGKTSTGRSRR